MLKRQFEIDYRLHPQHFKQKTCGARLARLTKCRQSSQRVIQGGAVNHKLFPKILAAQQGCFFAGEPRP
ncbi:MAG: hypothetical protein DMG26_14345 [Acidobacteria bacterium]|nr:MAG: hypothetical protein DMG26_14345 [Acidobacteriota bacterium]